MQASTRRRVAVFAACALAATFRTLAAGTNPAPDNVIPVGVAQVDITPDYSVRLSGFGFRRSESEGVRQRIWAKALAIGSDAQQPAVLIAVDNLGIPDYMVEDLAGRLAKKAGIKRDRLAVTATHTHTAPMLARVVATLYSIPIPAEHQQHIDRYTRELADKLEQVALAALADRKPARLSWGIGKATFAANRRTKGGPVDHDLPMLAVHDLDGKLRAVYTSYACHCVALSDNRVSGDWAGYAQEAIQKDHPGAVALMSVGCGADANPSSGISGDRGDAAAERGMEVASEVKRLLAGKLTPVLGKLQTQSARVDLPLDKPRTQEEWESRVKQGGAVGYHAQVNLARLARGEKLPTKIDYPIESWQFGNSLAMVFLPGEVVVDYSLRLKRELDGSRLWVNAYANDAPCYIPSERVLKEGGYEGGDAMVYYDVPNRFAPGLEKIIVDAVHLQLDGQFKSTHDPARTGGTRPLSPERSLGALRVADEFAVELVAAEPLVVDPVAIDFGPDGRIWVCEMHDYPAGKQGDFQPGGRVKVLYDDDGDGKPDRASVFLDGIPFPTGVTAWRKGVLVCAAPDISYAEDTNGDGRADAVRKLYSGFGTGNYQARVNSLCYGLDGWVYGACGLFGGTITSHQTGKTLALGDRDFRIRPDTGEIEPVTGQTQQGRVRNDWGDWFGCDNSTLLRHYPVVEHYMRRNQHVVSPSTAVFVPTGDDPNRLFPISEQVLFQLSGPPGRVTAACGLGIYRDELLGEDYRGDAFVCDPVNNLVHHLHVEPRGTTFAGRRPASEKTREFLASTDRWFRPVQARTGPDGALWIVDMYRYVIEHPRWIPPDVLATLDVRAGDTMGRIYRVYRKDRPPRRPARLDNLDTAGLVAALDSPNGTQRDLAQQMLQWKKDRAANPLLKALALECPRPETRMQALCTLDVLGPLAPNTVGQALADKHPGVRRHAVRTGATRSEHTAFQFDPAKESDPQVLMQLAYTLGEADAQGMKSGRPLAVLMNAHGDDEYLLSAALSSLDASNLHEVIGELIGDPAKAAPHGDLLGKVLAASAGTRGGASYYSAVIGRAAAPPAAWQLRAVGGGLEGLARANRASTSFPALITFIGQARSLAVDPSTPKDDRLAAIGVLGRVDTTREDDLPALASLLGPQNGSDVQLAALAALGRINDQRVPVAMIERWPTMTPGLRSRALEAIFSRDAWLVPLLEGVEKGRVAAADLDALHRQRLLFSEKAQVKELAERVLSAAAISTRRQVLNDYKDVAALTGDATRGKPLFAKHCSVCHQVDGQGYAAGPDLRALADKSPQKLLESILDPTMQVDPRYTQYIAATNDGRTFSGLLANETENSITLRGQEGREQTLLRSEIDALRDTGKSLMPEGLEKDLAKQDLADVIRYLAALGSSPKTMPGNRPELIQAQADGTLVLKASSGEIYGGEIVFETPFGNIGYWHGEQDHADWIVQLDAERKLDVYFEFACAADSAGNKFLLEAADQQLRGVVPSTGGWDKYRQEKFSTLALPAGRHRFTLRPDGPPRSAMIDLRAIKLVPAGNPPPK